MEPTLRRLRGQIAKLGLVKFKRTHPNGNYVSSTLQSCRGHEQGGVRLKPKDSKIWSTDLRTFQTYLELA
ncbi:hypothetical protein LshimejAT787_0504570 [Lyophyllum shimeji]|uniref:Uncharacterized protein n=1 Tax=Lyophyllum shimeji TaxID=47721 RepID=A0A9P3UMR1_LYOSH|nr:hypothetical protein LshimejAT787_0504570 [Lyophyllum shimeji]